MATLPTSRRVIRPVKGLHLDRFLLRPHKFCEKKNDEAAQRIWFFLSHLTHLAERIMTNALKHRVVASFIDLSAIFIYAESLHKFFKTAQAAAYFGAPYTGGAGGHGGQFPADDGGEGDGSAGGVRKQMIVMLVLR